MSKYIAVAKVLFKSQIVCRFGVMSAPMDTGAALNYAAGGGRA